MTWRRVRLYFRTLLTSQSLTGCGWLVAHSRNQFPLLRKQRRCSLNVAKKECLSSKSRYCEVLISHSSDTVTLVHVYRRFRRSCLRISTDTVNPSETSVHIYQSAWRHIPEDCQLSCKLLEHAITIWVGHFQALCTWNKDQPCLSQKLGYSCTHLGRW
jgi:hypothetical protein